MLADRQHRRGHVPRDGLRQQVGELGEGADHRLVVLVAPTGDEASREEEHDRLGHGEVQGRQEVLALDSVAATARDEDRDRELLIERIDVSIDRPGGHARESGDLCDRDALLSAPRAVEDRRHAQQSSEPIALAANTVVCGLVVGPLVGGRISLHRPDGTPRRCDRSR